MTGLLLALMQKKWQSNILHLRFKNLFTKATTFIYLFSDYCHGCVIIFKMHKKAIKTKTILYSYCLVYFILVTEKLSDPLGLNLGNKSFINLYYPCS